MKQRLISAAVALVLLAAVFACYQTVVLNIAVGLIAGMAVFELLHATGYVGSKAVLVFSVLYGFLIPFFGMMPDGAAGYITLLYLVLLVGMLLWRHNEIRFEAVAVSFFLSASVPAALSCIVRLRDQYEDGLLYMLLCCIAAWISDSCAYFAGRAFGKHKMCPQISPHKTIEGAVGGVAGCVAFSLLACWLYGLCRQGAGAELQFNWALIALLAAVCSLISIAGDLTASVIKRQRGIKDFGKIMPGHGGVMDRFDSFIFVAPAVCLFVRLFPILTI